MEYLGDPKNTGIPAKTIGEEADMGVGDEGCAFNRSSGKVDEISFEDLVSVLLPSASLVFFSVALPGDLDGVSCALAIGDGELDGIDKSELSSKPLLPSPRSSLI